MGYIHRVSKSQTGLKRLSMHAPGATTEERNISINGTKNIWQSVIAFAHNHLYVCMYIW